MSISNILRKIFRISEPGTWKCEKCKRVKLIRNANKIFALHPICENRFYKMGSHKTEKARQRMFKRHINYCHGKKKTPDQLCIICKKPVRGRTEIIRTCIECGHVNYF